MGAKCKYMQLGEVRCKEVKSFHHRVGAKSAKGERTTVFIFDFGFANCDCGAGRGAAALPVMSDSVPRTGLDW